MRPIYQALLVATTIFMIGTPSFAKGRKKAEGGEGTNASAAEPGQVPKSTRERTINREGRQKKGDKSKIDFESESIGGMRKQPLGSLVSQNKPDKEYDFVKLRWQWHPEMVQSASSLEGGRSR